MRISRLFLFALLLIFPRLLCAQSLPPSIAPTATYTDERGVTVTETDISASAPLPVRFEAHPEHTDGWQTHYEWRFYRDGQRTTPYLVRYAQDTDYTFDTSGHHLVELWATFTQGKDTVAYTRDYWAEEGQPIRIEIHESKLEMPNAFSPNGDGINDVYKAKDGYRSILDFQASIFNRWGQKLFSWDDPAKGWDGAFHGKQVPEGVYFVVVKAKGADGKVYHIRRDVNLLRGYTTEGGLRP